MLEIMPGELCMRLDVHRRLWEQPKGVAEAAILKEIVSPCRPPPSPYGDCRAPIRDNRHIKPVFVLRKHVTEPGDLNVVLERVSKIDCIGTHQFPSLKKIMVATILYYNIGEAVFLSPQRAAAIVRPRHVFFYLAQKMAMRSFPEIGRFAGGRDHTTVLHGVRKITNILKDEDSDGVLTVQIKQITDIINGTLSDPNQLTLAFDDPIPTTRISSVLDAVIAGHNTTKSVGTVVIASRSAIACCLSVLRKRGKVRLIRRGCPPEYFGAMLNRKGPWLNIWEAI
jgi:Bacterial dnaA protein helix-turn-helix